MRYQESAMLIRYYEILKSDGPKINQTDILRVNGVVFYTAGKLYL